MEEKSGETVRDTMGNVGESLQTPRPCPPSPGCLLPTQVLRCRPGLSGDPLWPSVLQVGKSVSLNVGPAVAPVNRGGGGGPWTCRPHSGREGAPGDACMEPGGPDPSHSPQHGQHSVQGLGAVPNVTPESTRGEAGR